MVGPEAIWIYWQNTSKTVLHFFLWCFKGSDADTSSRRPKRRNGKSLREKWNQAII